MEKKKTLWVIKLGGQLLDEPQEVSSSLSAIQTMHDSLILVHGGGKMATELAAKLGVKQTMVEGRRITDEATLDIALMCYAGLINKKLVAAMQAIGVQAIGLSGADAGTIPAKKRQDPTIDFGWVGDPIQEKVNTPFLLSLLEGGLVPVFCAL